MDRSDTGKGRTTISSFVKKPSRITLALIQFPKRTSRR